MLYLASTDQQAEDDISQIRVLKNPIFELELTSASMHHHDFTIWGRVIDCGLNRRGSDSVFVRKVFSDTQNLVLQFLKTRTINQADIAKMPFRLIRYNTSVSP
jgi:hypothetical protein